ncbi:MAG: hypothetical protein ACLFTJ_12490 [Halothece sp.]
MVRIGEVLEEDGVEYVVTGVYWVGEPRVLKEPLSEASSKVLPDYNSLIGKAYFGSIITGETIGDDLRINYILGSEHNFNPENVDDPFIDNDFEVIDESELL